MAIVPHQTPHTRRSDRRIGGSAAWGGHDRAIARAPALTATRSSIACKVGRLHLLHRGVYAVGHRPPVTARHGHGGGARLRPRRRAEPRIGRGTVEDHSALAHADRRDRAERTRPPGHPRPPLTPRRHDHPLRHPRHDTPAHARRPRRRPHPQTTHPSHERGPGPTTRHPRRADHPPHPISRPAHTHNSRRSGAPPAHPSKTTSSASSNATACHSPSSTRPSPATKSTPSTEQQRSSSNSTAANSTPPPEPSRRTATATLTSSMRSSQHSASPTTASRINEAKEAKGFAADPQPPIHRGLATSSFARTSPRNTSTSASSPASCSPPRTAAASATARSRATKSSGGQLPRDHPARVGGDRQQERVLARRARAEVVAEVVGDRLEQLGRARRVLR